MESRSWVELSVESRPAPGTRARLLAELGLTKARVLAVRRRLGNPMRKPEPTIFRTYKCKVRP